MRYYDERMAQRAGAFRIGRYLQTYISPHEQVRGDFFEQEDGRLITYVHYLNGYELETATDNYEPDLDEIARQLGHKGVGYVRYA
jgi:hypothetical protein